MNDKTIGSISVSGPNLTGEDTSSHEIKTHHELNVLDTHQQQKSITEPLNPSDKDKNDPEKYPEGGTQAWLVVLGSWCAMTACMGLLNTIGALHAWISTHQLQEYSASQVGWVFSVYTFFLYFGGVQVGPIFDVYGTLPIIIPGSIGLVASILFLSVSTEFYQIMLSFGILGGLSSCCLFTPSIAAIGHWFQRRRGLATGLACTAGGTGGLIFSLLILFLAPTLGFPWTLRIVAFLCAFLCIIACFLLKTRLPPHTTANASIDLLALREPRCAAVTLAVFLVEFAVMIPYTYIVDEALHAGLSQSKAYTLIPILNAAAIPGRAFPGYIADHCGRFNTMTLTTTTCALLNFCLWFPARNNHVAIFVYTILFGFWSGAAISLTPVCVAQVCETRDIGKRNGTTFMISSFAVLVGIPIAGAIVGREGGGYRGLILFAGGLYTAATAAFVLARGLAGGWGVRVVV